METWECEIIYELEIGARTREQKGEDTPETYRVVKHDSPSGILVYGLYGGKWVPNPSCRELIAHLLRTIT